MGLGWGMFLRVGGIDSELGEQSDGSGLKPICEFVAQAD
jgi:hypothetical protein